jgi:sodium transport system permease protein
MKGALLIVKKEFMELSKDRKTMFFTFLMPLILYPLLFSMMAKLGKNDEAQRENKPSRIYLVDPSGLVAPVLKANPAQFQIVGAPEGDLAQALHDQKLEMSLQVDAKAAEKFSLHQTWDLKAIYDRSDDSSKLALDRVKKAMAAQDVLWVQARLKAMGASSELAVPTRVVPDDVGGVGRTVAKFLGSFLPYILMVMMYAGSMQQGIYATAGEKERGTLLSLLSTSIPRNQIIIGKVLYVFCVGILVAVVNLLSMAFAMTRLVASEAASGAAAGAAQGGAASIPGLAALASPMVLLLTFLLMVPLGLLFANFIILGGIQARNTVEAGTALMPGVLVVVFLGVFSMAPGIEKMTFLPYIPVVNVSLAIRKLFSQQASAWEYIVAFAMTVGLAAVMTWLSTRMLRRESAIFKV